MSTRYTDRDKEQETPPGDSQSIYTANTVQQAKASPPESFPQPPRRPSGTGRNRWFVVAAVIVALALIISVGIIVIPQLGQHPATQVTPTPTAPVTTVTPSGSDTTPSPTPGVVPGPQNGPPGVSNTAYWDGILGTQGTNGKVERVSFANVLGNPTLQALVTVRHSDANSTLDVYVFDKITNAKPVQLFKLQGLVKGDAKISYYNSVMTAEVDQNSPLNAGKSSAQWTQDLFREFAWNAGEGTLTQVAFPGIFPDLTRYQAEADQASVNQGQQPWKLSATLVARTLAVNLLNWSLSSSTTLLSGGGAHDVSAVVRVRNSTVVSGAIKVTLSRLEGNTNGGIWEAVAVAVDGMSITSPVQPAVLSSPVSVKGTGEAFEGLIGQVMVLDHLYNTLGKTSATGVVGMGPTSFSTSLYYQSTFPAGIQEGVLVLYAPSNANGSIAAAVMVKVLVNGAPERTFAVESVDLTVTLCSAPAACIRASRGRYRGV